ncbi:MAG: hypothetical protein WBQ94_09580 [Terracidiphilus sp.]
MRSSFRFARSKAALPYAMMAYERIVNSTGFPETLRIIIVGAAKKP